MVKMALPNSHLAYVDRSKIVDYLLSIAHADGRSKAQFFFRFGFRLEEWNVLAEALRTVGTSNPVTSVVESPHGLRYTVDGSIETPDGRSPRVRTVWIVEPGSAGPRLITAHPL